MGYYRSDITKEKVIVRLDADDRMDFYTGGIDDRTRLEGTYKISGDSVSFTYKTTDGEEVVMQGHFNRRRTYMDGVCRTNNKPCLLYTSDAADERSSVDLGGRRIIKKK